MSNAPNAPNAPIAGNLPPVPPSNLVAKPAGRRVKAVVNTTPIINANMRVSNDALVDTFSNNVVYYESLFPLYEEDEGTVQDKNVAFNEEITTFTEAVKVYELDETLLANIKSSYKKIIEFITTHDKLQSDITNRIELMDILLTGDSTNGRINLTTNKNNSNPKIGLSALNTLISTKYGEFKERNKAKVNHSLTSYTLQLNAKLSDLQTRISALVTKFTSLKGDYQQDLTDLNENWDAKHTEMSEQILVKLQNYYKINTDGISALLAEFANSQDLYVKLEKLVEAKKLLVKAQEDFATYYENPNTTSNKKTAFGNNFNVAQMATISATIAELVNNIDQSVTVYLGLTQAERERIKTLITSSYENLITKITQCLTESTSNNVLKPITEDQDSLLRLLSALEPHEWTKWAEYANTNKANINNNKVQNPLNQVIKNTLSSVKAKLNFKTRTLGARNSSVGNAVPVVGNNENNLQGIAAMNKWNKKNTVIPQGATGNNGQNKWTNNGSRYLGNFYNKPVENASRIMVAPNSRNKYGPYYTKVVGNKINRSGNPMVGRKLPMA